MNISFLWEKRKVSKPLSKPWIFYISFHLEEKMVQNESLKVDHVRSAGQQSLKNSLEFKK